MRSNPRTQIGSRTQRIAAWLTGHVGPVVSVRPVLERQYHRPRAVYLVVIVLGLVLGWNHPVCAAVVGQEYQVKAAFLYNFIRFVDWPEDRMLPAEGPLIVGVVGTDPFGKALEVVASKPAKGKEIEIRRFPSAAVVEVDAQGRYPDLERMKECHLVFIVASERAYLPRLLPVLTEATVLTVGEMNGFLEAGGMINFMTQGTKNRFEIHLNHVRQARLEVRAKLLRLAQNVVEK